MRGFGANQASKPITADQQNAVRDILSNYDANNSNAFDSLQIVKSFRDAGVRGPNMRDALQSAGFDASQICSLAHGGLRPTSSDGQGQGTSRSMALQSLQIIMSQYDLSNMSGNDQKDLYSQLTSSGSLKTGG